MDHRQGGSSLLSSSNLGVLQPGSVHGGGGGAHGGDAALAWALWGFAFVALVLEPLVYFGCLSADGVSVAADWRISHCPDGVVSAVRVERTGEFVKAEVCTCTRCFWRGMRKDHAGLYASAIDGRSTVRN